MFLINDVKAFPRMLEAHLFLNLNIDLWGPPDVGKVGNS